MQPRPARQCCRDESARPPSPRVEIKRIAWLSELSGGVAVSRELRLDALGEQAQACGDCRADQTRSSALKADHAQS